MSYFVNKLFFLWLFLAPIAQGATIIIDPGHGGEDLGAQVTYQAKGKQSTKATLLEKDITLAISKILHQQLKQRGHQVYLTRSHDRTISLSSRSEMATKVKADIFISIHANSSPQATSRGVETFYLDNHKNKAMEKIERMENSALLKVDQSVRPIILDLMVSRAAPQSKELASKIHHALIRGAIKKYHLKDRGIRPGLFYVLALAQRPSVLLEVGFLSNSQERTTIVKQRFQQDYARGVVTGIENWLQTTRPQKKPPLHLF